MLITRRLIMGVQAENHGWIQTSSVADDKIVGAVAKTAGKKHLRASPAFWLVADPEVQGALVVDPGVIRIVEIV
jgi:hypothetical protein